LLASDASHSFPQPSLKLWLLLCYPFVKVRSDQCCLESLPLCLWDRPREVQRGDEAVLGSDGDSLQEWIRIRMSRRLMITDRKRGTYEVCWRARGKKEGGWRQGDRELGRLSVRPFPTLPIEVHP
jgi:hypothetical protein